MKLGRVWRPLPAEPLNAFERRLEALVRSATANADLAQMLAYHFGYLDATASRKGKRLRPRLVLAVAEQERGDGEVAMDAALAIELLHNYSLIHDDIEDGDRFRHNRETLWVRYGVAQAINAGDAMCALSYLALAPQPELLRTLLRANLAMCEGQTADLAFEQAGRIEVEGYVHMIAGKTAALFGASCELGARSAAAAEPVIEAYRAAGHAFGMAFQMIDDLLGIWGDADRTGKIAGNDIVRRKQTYPIVWALSQPPSTARSVIEAAYRSTAPAPDVGMVIDALDTMGAQGAARAAAAQHLAVVERAPAGPVRDFLLASLPAVGTGEIAAP